MNDEARSVILDHFCKTRRLSGEDVPGNLADIVCAVTAPYFLMIECLDQLDVEDPAGGLLTRLISRTYDTAAGSLTLIAIGHLREAEILSRSVLESSATTSYIASNSPAVRLAQYFSAYVRQEREQNRKWQNEIAGLPAEARAEHQLRIDQKNNALGHYEKFIDLYVDQSGINPESAKVWPGLIDRLDALDRRIDYRTIYAAMCSQAHHDAEDILNHFFVNSVEGLDGMAQRMEREADTFSIFMVLCGLRWFVEATGRVCTHLNFSTAVDEAKISLQRIQCELEIITECLPSGELPPGWITGSR